MPMSGAWTGPRQAQTPGTERCPRCVVFQDCPFRSLPVTSPLTGEPLVREQRFRRGDTLRREGASRGLVQVIKVGSVLATRRGLDGVARPVSLMGRGHVMGRLEPQDHVSALSCQAVSAGRLCELRLTELGDAMTEDFRRRMMERAARSFADLADWAHVTRVRGVVGQLAAALIHLERMQHSSTVQLPGQTALGALLGTSRETVARALTQLERRGGVQREGRGYCRVNTAQLLQEVSGTVTTD